MPLTYFILRRTFEQVHERLLYILSEPGCEHILVRSELMPRLPHDRVDHVQPGHLVLGLALQYELLDALHYVLVELDRLYCAPGDRRHLRLGDRRLHLVQRGELRRRIGALGGHVRTARGLRTSALNAFTASMAELGYLDVGWAALVGF